MSNAKDSPQLKRKRELKSEKNKAKRQRRSNGGGEGQDGLDMDVDVAPTAELAGTPVKTAKEDKNKKNRVNGDIATPGSSKSGLEEHRIADQPTPTQATKPAQSTPRKTKKNNHKHGGHIAVEDAEADREAQLNGEVKADLEGTPAKPSGTVHQSGKKNKSSKGDRQSSDAMIVIGKSSGDIDTVNGAQQSSNRTMSTPKADKKKKDKKSGAWSVSRPMGGCFLPQDPIFSQDEKHLILAHATAVQVYAAETSLLSRTLVIRPGTLSTYALSPTKPDHLYTVSSTDLVTLWDWTSGKKVARWEVGVNIRQIRVVKQPDADRDLVYCYQSGHNNHRLEVHSLPTGSEASQTEVKEILQTESSVTSFEVLLEGAIVVVACKNSIIVGRRSRLQKTALKDFEYTWREFQTPRRITTFSTFVRDSPSVKGTKQAHGTNHIVDVALGNEDGVIFAFEDVLTKLVKLEKEAQKKGAQLESLNPRRLHWHREAVGSLKWSKDGHYIISGGKETVLVIWQLSTGKQQHLPHLTSAIGNIVVSPQGASYAVSLAHNSVMVLSTSEFEAKTYIVGLQSRRINREKMPRGSQTDKYPFRVLRRVPMAVNPREPNEVLLSVPSSQPFDGVLDILGQPYIQSFNLATHMPGMRQALTRNNATDINVGPNLVKIAEPSVEFLQLSSDGKWLASIDDWLPPRTDMTHIEEGDLELDEQERSFRREVNLKIWRWDSKSEVWTLDTRLDAPHGFEEFAASARVFDLVAEPRETGFATVGEDGHVRIWRPKTRLRDGVVVRGANQGDEALVTWSLYRDVELSSRLDVLDDDSDLQWPSGPQNACLAFSADGSVLAVGVSQDSEADPGAVHIIDTEAGTIRRSITELDATDLACLGLIDRFLIAVGDSIVVWDLVVDKLVYCIPFDLPDIPHKERASLVHLAINELDGTFAVSIPIFEHASSKVFVFRPDTPKELWSSTMPAFLLALVPARDGKGYITLDNTSSIRTLSPSTSSLRLEAVGSEPAEAQVMVNGAIAGEEATDVAEEAGQSNGILDLDGTVELSEDAENDKPVVRPEQLEDFFDRGSQAAPPKAAMNALIDMYARKTKGVAA